MRIQEISWRNFNSYGNQLQHVVFEEGKGELFLLMGGNGNGKSTIAEVITFALYGKIERKNKTDLPNRINKNLWCRILIRSRNKTIEIIRGVAPGIFEVNIDGAPYETAGNSNIQDYLELELYDIPYQVFKNIIVLSVNDFRSFLTMSPGDKRNIIDRLFGFSIINQMKDTIRNERKEIKEQIKTLTDELGIIESSISSINEKIKALEESKKEDKTKLIQDYRNKISELLENKKQIDGSLSKVREVEAKISKLFDDKKSEFAKIGYDIKSIDEKINLYNNSMCPTCGSDLHTEHHQEVKTLLDTERQTKKEQFDSLKGELTENQTKIQTLKEKIKEFDNSIVRINLLVNQYTREMNNIVSEAKEVDVNYLEQLSKENIQKKDAKKRLHGEKAFEDTFLDTVESILGEDGVKNLAMKTILPSLNQSISNMSKQMHLPYNLKFDDKFDCIINSLGEEINPRSMSTGERKKADFIIIIALLKMLKIRYPSLNILFLDEIFSSVDGAGVYEIIKILKEVSMENLINTWVINHTELPMELFDKRVEAVKEGGFSKLTIENIT